MVWNCVSLGYRLKKTYLSDEGTLKVKLSIILLLTYNPVDLLKFRIDLQNRYQIDNLVMVITHSHYMSQYII